MTTQSSEVDLTPACSLPPAELIALFNSAYSDYLVPLAFDEDAFQHHLTDNDIDLETSRVALASTPVGFALIGRRGREAWVGGMGTAPACRRRGVAERTLRAALEAAAQTDVEAVRLEVLEKNEAAISLYERLGFVATRRLIVCSLREPEPPRSDWRPLDVDDARTWIAQHRATREPWQRDNPVLRRMADSGRPLAAIGIPGSGRLTAALICTSGPAGTRVLQMAARDEPAAAEGLRVAGAAAGIPVHLLNFPADEPVAAALARLGAHPDHIQHEMQLRLAAQ